MLLPLDFPFGALSVYIVVDGHIFLLLPLLFSIRLLCTRVHVQLLSHVQLFASPWTTITPRLLCPWGYPGKNPGVGCHFLLQGIFPTQASNPCLMAPALTGGLSTTEPPGKPLLCTPYPRFPILSYIFILLTRLISSVLSSTVWM